jgi:hypothetical protein
LRRQDNQHRPVKPKELHIAIGWPFWGRWLLAQWLWRLLWQWLRRRLQRRRWRLLLLRLLRLRLLLGMLRPVSLLL